MIIRIHRGIACVNLIAWFFAQDASAQNIIDQTYGAGTGSFELGTFVDNGQGFMPLAPGSTAIAGWTVAGPGDGIKWLGPAQFKSVDLTLGAASSIHIGVPTMPSFTYLLSFDFFNPTGLGGNRFAYALAGSQGGLVATDDQGVIRKAFEFTATSASTEITFQGTGMASSGPGIDNVSVTFVGVPEPSAVSLLVGGAFALCVARRKRFRLDTW